MSAWGQRKVEFLKFPRERYPKVWNCEGSVGSTIFISLSFPLTYRFGSWKWRWNFIVCDFENGKPDGEWNSKFNFGILDPEIGHDLWVMNAAFPDLTAPAFWIFACVRFSSLAATNTTSDQRARLNFRGLAILLSLPNQRYYIQKGHKVRKICGQFLLRQLGACHLLVCTYQSVRERNLLSEIPEDVSYQTGAFAMTVQHTFQLCRASAS